MFGILIAILAAFLATVFNFSQFIGSLVGPSGGGGLVGGGGLGFGGAAPGITAGSVGIPIVDSDYRHGDLATVDAWAGLTLREGGTQAGIDVPADSKIITSITVAWAGTASTPGAAGEVHSHFGMRMSGSGLRSGGSYRFLAGGVSTLIVGTGDIAGAWFSDPVTYPTNIQCKSSGSIDIEGIMMGEDLGTVTMTVTLTFAPTGTPGGYTDGDFREGDLTALNTFAALTYIGATAEGDMLVPEGTTQLSGVVIQNVLDPGTSAATVGLIGAVQLTGGGLKEGGTFRFTYVGESVCGATGGDSIEASHPVLFDTEIGVKPNQKIQAAATMLGADPGGATIAVGFLWR